MVYQHLHEMVFVPLKLELPPEWQVTFKWTRDVEAFGWTHQIYDGPDFPEYYIEISSECNTCYLEVLESMCHEMIHVHLCDTGYKKWDEHGKKFHEILDKVVKYTGFEPL